MFNSRFFFFSGYVNRRSLLLDYSGDSVRRILRNRTWKYSMVFGVGALQSVGETSSNVGSDRDQLVGQFLGIGCILAAPRSDGTLRLHNIRGSSGFLRYFHMEESSRDEEQNDRRNQQHVQTKIVSVKSH